jgi:hypothetical protein
MKSSTDDACLSSQYILGYLARALAYFAAVYNVYNFTDIYRQHSVNFWVNKYVHSYLIASSLIFLLRHVCNYKLKIILPGV